MQDRAPERASEHEARAGDLLRYAVVDSVDLAAGKLVVRQGDKRLGPVDWFMPRAGATVIWSPPSVGEQGLLLCPEGDAAFGVFLPGVRSSQHAAPLGDTRELLIRLSDGAEISYDAAGHVMDLRVAAGGKLRFAADRIELN